MWFVIMGELVDLKSNELLWYFDFGKKGESLSNLPDQDSLLDPDDVRRSVKEKLDMAIIRLTEDFFQLRGPARKSQRKVEAAKLAGADELAEADKE